MNFGCCKYIHESKFNSESFGKEFLCFKRLISFDIRFCRLILSLSYSQCQNAPKLARQKRNILPVQKVMLKIFVLKPSCSQHEITRTTRNSGFLRRGRTQSLDAQLHGKVRKGLALVPVCNLAKASTSCMRPWCRRRPRAGGAATAAPWPPSALFRWIEARASRLSPRPRPFSTDLEFSAMIFPFSRHEISVEIGSIWDGETFQGLVSLKVEMTTSLFRSFNLIWLERDSDEKKIKNSPLFGNLDFGV